MKKNIILLCCGLLTSSLFAQNTGSIVLNQPDTTGGLPVMKALSLRASQRDFDTVDLKLQDLSNLLWAANGVNRRTEGKRTAPSAQNAQDIDIFVFLKTGTYLYNAQKNVLEFQANGDNRNLFPGKPGETTPPLICLMVSDISRFKFGEDSIRLEWGAMDAGIVSQNITIFCASAGLATRPRSGFDRQKIKDLLKLKPTQYPMMNTPVSYKKH